MDKLIFLLVLVIVKMIFMIIPFDGQLIGFFPFSEVKTTIHTYAYFLAEHFGYVFLSYIIYCESQKYRIALFTFFILMCADLLDYVFSYNSPWFFISATPITMNVVICTVFGISIVIEAVKNNDYA